MIQLLFVTRSLWQSGSDLGEAESGVMRQMGRLERCMLNPKSLCGRVERLDGFLWGQHGRAMDYSAP